MGISTNAVIAFGIDLGENMPNAWGEYFEMSEYLGNKAGLVKPKYPSKDYNSYLDKICNLEKKYPLSVQYHCSADYPMIFVALKKTVLSAYRGSPETFKPESFSVSKSDIKILKDFFSDNEIQWTNPQWHLFSYMG